MAKGRNGGGGFPATTRSWRHPPRGASGWPRPAALVVIGQLDVSQVTAEERRLDKAVNKLRPQTPSPAYVDDLERSGLPLPPRADDTRQQMRAERHVLNPRTKARCDELGD